MAITKAYSTQLVACYLLAVQLAKARGQLNDQTYQDMIAELQKLPEKMEHVLEDKERIQWFAAKYANAHDVIFIGRGIDYAVSLEDTANFTVYVPKTNEHFAGSLAVIPLQLLGYYMSAARGLYVDKPRKLAKSVTVE